VQNLTATDKFEQKKAYRLLIGQLITGLVISILFLIFQSVSAGYSALLGALVTVMPSCVFVRMVFRSSGAREARNTVIDFYKAELLKFCLMGVLLVLVFKFVPITPASFFATFIATMVVPLIMPLMAIRSAEAQ
tara:strand:+ start:7708 stop:8109 length:402 start_codon:yes stop_codon:yes gene_type:complete